MPSALTGSDRNTKSECRLSRPLPTQRGVTPDELFEYNEGRRWRSHLTALRVNLAHRATEGRAKRASARPVNLPEASTEERSAEALPTKLDCWRVGSHVRNLNGRLASRTGLDRLPIGRAIDLEE